MSRSRLLLIVSILACACEARPSASPSAPQLDKRAVFGSASLVPTREGERARRELAIAGELERALAQLELSPAQVHVELREPVTVIVIGRVSEQHDVKKSEATVAELAHALVPDLAPANLHLWLLPARVEPPAPDSSSRTWLLMLACIGLGVSLGITGERLKSRW